MPVNHAKEFLKSVHTSAAAVLYFYNWPEILMAASNLILRIGALNLVQGHLR